ncbi:glutathione S-transferase [Methylosoma difficile]
MNKLPKLPILYTFRRCPYAMRARLALAYAGISVEIREIELKNKPQALRDLSPKATVPVLQLPDGKVLEESLDIMHWALAQHDPAHWLADIQSAKTLITWNDGDFKYYLDRYKYADRHPEYSADHYRRQGEFFLAELESRLQVTPWLLGDHCTLADAAIFPFIRQFAAVDEQWFAAADYPAVQQWLQKWLDSALFAAVMDKYPAWVEGMAAMRGFA